MKAVYLTAAVIVGLIYLIHVHIRDFDMEGLHILIIWAALLIAGAVS